MERRYR